MADTVVQKLELDISDFDSKIGRTIAGWDALDERTKKAAAQNPFKQQIDELAKLDGKMRSAGQTFLQVAQGPKQTALEINRMSTEVAAYLNAQKKVGVSGDWKQTQDQIKKTKTELDGLNKKLDETASKQTRARDNSGRFVSTGAGTRSSGSTPDSVGPRSGEGGFLSGLTGTGLRGAGQLLGAFGVGLGVGEVIKDITEVTADFQKYNAVLTNTLGSQAAAAESMQLIQKFAAETPFSVNELTESFVKLANRGFVPNEIQLKELADLAASVGKPFDQLVEAVLDAQTGEFERLKEFGIKAQKNGSDISFTFKGQTEVVKNTESTIRDYILSLGDLKGVAGSTASISETLTGQISNLGDSVDTLYVKIGKKLAPIFSLLIGAASGALTSLSNFFKTTKDEANDSLSAYEGQVKSVQNLKTNIEPLLDRYDQLSEKARNLGGETKLSKDEQAELKNAITQVSEVIPDAISAQNKYGQVMFINTGIARDYITEQERVSKVLNADSIQKYTQALQLAQSRTKSLQGQLVQLQGATPTENGQPAVSAPTNSGNNSTGFKPGGISETERASMIGKIRTDLAVSVEEAKNLQATIDYLNGKAPKPTSVVKPPAVTPPVDAKAALAAAVEAEKERKDLLDKKEKLNTELQKLQEDFNKQRLESLDKDSQEYLDLKRQVDLQDLADRRAAAIKLGQETTGHYVVNMKTKKHEYVNNMDYKLPDNIEEGFTKSKEAISSGPTSGSLFEASINASVAKSERQAYLDRSTQQRLFGELQVEEQQKQNDLLESLQRKAGQSETDYEREKQEKLLAIKIEYAKKQLALIENDPSKKAEIESLRTTIIDAQNTLKDSKAQGKDGPKDLFDLLGIKFSDNATQNDKMKQAASDLAGTVITEGQNILAAQIAASQQQVANYDQQLQAKQSEIDEEIALSKQGLASNVAAKRQEYDQIAQARQKALQQQAKDQAIQIALNTVLKESELALALAKIITNATSFGLLFPFVVGAEIATMFAVLASGVAQIQALPTYHTGDEITLATAQQRRMTGAPGPNEIDIRAELGEGVIRKESYQPNKALFTRLNKLGRKMEGSDLADLLDGTGVELSHETKNADLKLIYDVNEARGFAPDHESHRNQQQIIKKLGDVEKMLERFIPDQIQAMPNGDIRHTDRHGNIRTDTSGRNIFKKPK